MLLPLNNYDRLILCKYLHYNCITASISKWCHQNHRAFPIIQNFRNYDLRFESSQYHLLFLGDCSAYAAHDNDDAKDDHVMYSVATTHDIFSTKINTKILLLKVSSTTLPQYSRFGVPLHAVYVLQLPIWGIALCWSWDTQIRRLRGELCGDSYVLNFGGGDTVLCPVTDCYCALAF